MSAPTPHGGLELKIPLAVVQDIEALAADDGSIGWTAMINAGAALFPPMLPRQTCRTGRTL
jgi:hypothetical protein